MERQFVKALEAISRFYADARNCRVCEVVARRTEAADGDFAQVSKFVFPILENSDLTAKLPPPLLEFMTEGPNEL